MFLEPLLHIEPFRLVREDSTPLLLCLQNEAPAETQSPFLSTENNRITGDCYGWHEFPGHKNSFQDFATSSSSGPTTVVLQVLTVGAVI